MTKAYRSLLLNAYEAGSKKAVGAKIIENTLHIPYETYCQEMLALQESLHVYVLTQALDDKDNDKAAKLEEAKTVVYNKLKAMMERVPGILCEAGDILYLTLSAYKLAKSKDVEKDDGSYIIGTKRLVCVSASTFRVIVESMFGNKIAGNTWDCGLGDFRRMTDAERSRLDKKLEKKRAKETKAQDKAKEAAKPKEAKPAQEKPKAAKAASKAAKPTKPTIKAEPEKAEKTAVPMDANQVRLLDGTLKSA